MTEFRCRAMCRQMIMLPLTAVLALAPHTVSGAAANVHERAVTGQWRLTAALDGADITALDEKEAQQLVGQVLTISKKSVRFGERTCGPSGFEAESVEPRIFLREQFRADAGGLNLPNPVTVVDLSCTSVFIKSANKLVIAWKGWFFEAVRVKR